MLIHGNTVTLDKGELALLVAIASKDKDHPNTNAICLRTVVRSVMALATDGKRIVRGTFDCEDPDDEGCDMMIPLHVAKAAISLCGKESSPCFSRTSRARPRFEVDGVVVTWPEGDGVFPDASALFDLAAVDAVHMPIAALGAAYLSDAKLLSAATLQETTIIVHAPTSDTAPAHLLCGPWHYVVMPVATDQTKDVAKQLGLFVEPEPVAPAETDDDEAP